MSVEGGPDIVTDGLVLHLDAANNRSFVSGSNTWFDVSRNGNNGTLTNGPTYNSANGGSISFDGSNDYISFASTTVGSFNNATFSFGAWFYFDGTNQNNCIIGKRNDLPYNQYNMSISNDATNGGLGTKLACFLNDDLDSAGYTTLNYPLPSAGWYCAMVVINNNTQTLYVNGASVLTQSPARSYVGKTFNITGKPLYVGAINSNNNPAGFFKSRIAITYLYSISLSAKEVRQNYNATKGRYGLF